MHELLMMNFRQARRNKSKRLAKQNAHSPHQGKGEIERRRRQMAAHKLQVSR